MSKEYTCPRPSSSPNVLPNAFCVMVFPMPSVKQVHERACEQHGVGQVLDDMRPVLREKHVSGCNQHRDEHAERAYLSESALSALSPCIFCAGLFTAHRRLLRKAVATSR